MLKYLIAARQNKLGNEMNIFFISTGEVRATSLPLNLYRTISNNQRTINLLERGSKCHPFMFITY